MLALLLGGLAVRLGGIGAQGLGHDEPFTVYWASRPLAELMAQFQHENNPPLHFLLMHGWVRLVPLEEGWLRLPSAVFSACTLPFLYLLGRSMAGRTAGITAALLVLFSGAHQGFAHETRTYSLLVLLCTATVWQLHRAAQSDRHSWAWLAVCHVALVYTHFMAWCMIGVEVVAVLCLPGFRSARAPLFKALALTIVLFLPYAWTFFHRVGTSVSQGTWLSPPSWEEPYNMLWRWSNAPVLAVTFIALVLWSFRRPPVPPLGQFALLWTLLPLLGLFLLSFFVPLYLDRYLLFAAPGFALCVARALVVLGPERAPWALPAAAVLGMACTLPGAIPQRPVATPVVELLHERIDPGTVIVVAPYWYRLNLLWEWDRDAFRGEGPNTFHQDLLQAPLEAPHQVLWVQCHAPHPPLPTLVEERFGAGWTAMDSTTVGQQVIVHRFQRP